MDLIHGSGPWIRSMYLIHGSDPWIRSTDQIHGSDPWIRSMDQIHGSDPWIRSMDQMGRNRQHKCWPESVPISFLYVEIFDCSPWPGNRPSGAICVYNPLPSFALCSIYPMFRLLNPSPGDVLSGAIQCASR